MFTSNVHNTKKYWTHGPWTHDAGVPTPSSPKTYSPAHALNPRTHFVCTSNHTVAVRRRSCVSCSSTIITVCVHYPKLINQVVTFPWTPALLTLPAIDLSPNWKVFTLLFVCSVYRGTWSAVLSELVPSCTKPGEDVDLWHSLPVSVHELWPLADWSRLRFSVLMLVGVRIFQSKRIDNSSSSRLVCDEVCRISFFLTISSDFLLLFILFVRLIATSPLPSILTLLHVMTNNSIRTLLQLNIRRNFNFVLPCITV